MIALACFGCGKPLEVTKARQRRAGVKYPCCGAPKCSRRRERAYERDALLAAGKPIPQSRRNTCGCTVKHDGHTYTCAMKGKPRDPRIVALAQRRTAA